MKKRGVSLLFFGLFLAIFVFTFWRRFQMSLDRYFDPDEFMYLHWAYNIFSGERLYVDFFSHISPLYTILLSQFFKIGSEFEPIVAARVFSVVIFGIFAGSLSLLVWELRHSWTAVVAALVIVVIPIPTSKFIEVRPDTLGMTIFIIGLTLEINWLKGRRNWKLLGIGLLYALSFLVIQKTAYLIAVAIALLLWEGLRKSRWRFIRISLPWFAAGFIMPWVILLVWWKAADLETVLYSILVMPQEWFGNLPYRYWPGFYFEPNGFYYGGYGYSFGYIANLIFWGGGITLAGARFIRSFFIKDFRASVYKALAVMMFLQLGLYIFYLRVNFLQYLVPVAAFIAIFVADGLGAVWDRLSGGWGMLVGRPLVMLGMGYFCLVTFLTVSHPHYQTNEPTLEAWKIIWSQIHRTEYLFDLQGSTIYYRDPYYLCCIPDPGGINQLISRKLPSLRESLMKTKTKYVYQAYPYLLAGLSEDDRAFVEANYRQSDIGLLMVATKW